MAYAGFTPGNLGLWTARLLQIDLPVLRSTLRRLAQLRTEGEDETLSPHVISELVLSDPLMTARLYLHAHRRLGERHADVTTVQRLLMMLGVPPFLRAFSAPPLVEDMLQTSPSALKGLFRVVQRARRAARVAGALASWRNDPLIEEIMVAALLHDLAEMLIWYWAPEFALRMQRALDADASLRSVSVQREVLGVRLNDLQVQLARRWHLPELLIHAMDDAHANSPQVRTVLLAVNIARHSIRGWSNAALPDDYRDAALLLSTTPEMVLARLHPAPRAAAIQLAC